MKFEVFDGDGSKAKSPVRLKFLQVDDEICVAAVDEAGNLLPSGVLVRFTAEGRLHVCIGVSPNLGFDLDEEGRILDE